MKEQMNAIADVLESEKMTGDCTFHVNRQISDHNYDIVIERKKNRLELMAILPIHVHSDDCSMWVRKIREANKEVACGRFALCDHEHRVCYRVYSLYTSEREIKDSATVKALLDCCDRALEQQSETMLLRKKRRSIREWILDQLPVTFNEAEEVSE